MTELCVLGLDLGTSGCKAGLFTARGALLALERSAYAIERDAGGRAEQDPNDWWRGACAATRRVVQRAAVSPASIAAIGLSGQIGSQVLIDRHGRPLRPAITWQDTRSAGIWPRLTARFSRQRLADALGIDLPPGPAWPLPRLLWLQHTDPTALGRTWRLLQEKDYVAFRLTGELASDASSWRGLAHPGTNAPVTAILQALDLPADLLPPLRNPWAMLGRVTADAAAQIGLPAGTPVVTGWNDLNCALLGSGAVTAGTGFLIDGTSEHLGVTWECDPPAQGIASLMFAPYLLATPGGAPRVLYGVTSAGGGSLDWYAGQFVPDLLQAYGLALPEGSMARHEQIAAAIPPGAEGLIFLPYLYGERAPIWDATARGVLFGLHGAHRHAHVLRAVLEGVAFSLRQVLETVEAATGAAIPALQVSGGPAGIALWNQIKASILNRPLRVPAVLEASCLGAAMLATIHAQWYANPVAAAQSMVRSEKQIDPVPRDVARYEELFQIYAGLYPRLKDLYQQLATVRTQEGRS